MDANEELVETLRNAIAPAMARLTPDIEPAFTYTWREIPDVDAADRERDDEE